MKNILVTGGTGFLGSSLTRALVKQGYSVSVFDNDSRGKQNRLADIAGEYKFIKGDIRYPETVKNACKGKDIVMHLAFVNGTEFFYSKPELVLEVGVKGMMNVLDGCISHNVPELFLASSSEVYNQPPIIPTPETVPVIIPDPLNPRFSYSGGKIISELLAINYGRKYFKRTVIFRPHNVYGPDCGTEHVIPQLIIRMSEMKKQNGDKFDFPIQGTGEETRAFLYIDDLTNGILTLLGKGKNMEIYNIGGRRETKIKEVAEEIAKLMGCEIRIKPGHLPEGSTTRRLADITKISRLGFEPKISLDDGLKKTIDWYLSLG